MKQPSLLLYQQLVTLTDGLLLRSESDYPFEVRIVTDLAALALPNHTISPERLLQQACREYTWHTPEQVAVARRFQVLRALLEQYPDTTIYKTPPPVAHISIVLPTTVATEWVVVQSTAIET